MKTLFLFILITSIISNSWGQSTTILSNNFNDGTIGNGWQINSFSGNGSFQAGSHPDIENTGMGYYVYFVDDSIATPSEVQLVSPLFNGSYHRQLTLDFRVNFKTRTYQDSCYAYQGNEYKTIDCGEFNATAYASIDLIKGGDTSTIFTIQEENTNGFVQKSIDLSYIRGFNMKLLFNYNDNGQQTDWVAFDNITLTGTGTINDKPVNAKVVKIGDPCTIGDNTNALFVRGQSGCATKEVHGVWYKFRAPKSQKATVVVSYPDEVNRPNRNDTTALNDVLTIFKGTQKITCTNKDEFGFTGERLQLNNLQSGAWYLIRVSGAACTFGSPVGRFCVQVQPGTPAPTPPVHDGCATAIPITEGAQCDSLSNYYADTNSNSSCAENARADVWYTFTVPANSDSVYLYAAASFSHTKSVFEGTCNGLTEVVCEDFLEADASTFQLNGLTSGQTYFLKISGLFATLEGDLRVNMGSTCLPIDAPCNDQDSTTYDDRADGLCGCAGQPCPQANTPCQDGNIATHTDTWDGECNCNGIFYDNGVPCDDGSSATENDSWDGEGNCIGQCIDVGTPCNDGNPNTIADQWDGLCNCVGVNTGSCEDDIILSIIHKENYPVIINSFDHIVSYSIIEVGADVTYNAAQRISLRTGFHVKPGSRFRAKIQPCVNSNKLADTTLTTNPTESIIRNDKTNELSNKSNNNQVFNFPNPFREKTFIRYYLTQPTPVTLVVHDINGRLVSEVENSELQEAGMHTYTFNAKNQSAGIYMFTLITNESKTTGKMVCLK